MKNILVLSGTASAINYINAFAGDPDFRLHVTDANRFCPGLYVPGLTAHALPRARERKLYRAALDRILEEQAIDVLIPTSDYDVEGVMDYLRDGWSPNVSMFRPPLDAFDTLSHKGRLMARLREEISDIVPMTWCYEGSAAALQLPMPVVVKPIGESGGKGVSIVRQPADLASAIARIRALFGDRFLIQEYIPGSTYVATMVYDQAGSLVIGVGMRSHRTFFTWGGGGCAGEIVDEPQLLWLADDVVRACGGWRGPINFEWRRHCETGAFFLMEANCRLNGYSYLATMNGVCLPRIVLALLTGTKLPAVAAPSERNHNFVLGFRETLVESWVQSDVS